MDDWAKLLTGEDLEDEESDEDGSWDEADEPKPDPDLFALHEAAERGDVEKLRELLAPVEPDDDEMAPPVADEHVSVQQASLHAQQIDQRDPIWNCSPLHTALLHRQLQAMAVLLEAGAAATSSCEGLKPIHMAVRLGGYPDAKQFSIDASLLLIKHSADVCSCDDEGRSGIHIAALLGLSATLKILLDALSSDEERTMATSASDQLGDTPLHLAAASGCSVTVAMLLAVPGVQPNNKNKLGRTAMHSAATSGAGAAVVALLVTAGGEQCDDCYGFTPVQLAVNEKDTGAAAAMDSETAVVAPAEAAAAGGGTMLVTHEICRQHNTCKKITRQSDDEPPPENTLRLKVLVEEDAGQPLGALKADWASGCTWAQAPRLAIGDALRVHQWGYVQQLEAVCDSLSEPYELGYLDGEGGDTAVSELSFESALRSAGGVTLAIDQVLAGKHQNGFCAVRPPGHHAGPRGAVAPEHHLECKSHGFCLLNSVAIGAAYALSVHRATIKRVAILDFDVHHGNGTQSIIEATIPSTQRETREMLGTTISIKVPQCSPWLDPKSDSTAIFFSSVNGYGSSAQGGTFYPGSGATNDSQGGSGQ